MEAVRTPVEAVRKPVVAAWNLRGSRVEPVWNPRGNRVEPLWKLCGTAVEAPWKLCGSRADAARTPVVGARKPVEAAWNLRAWNPRGTPVEPP